MRSRFVAFGIRMEKLTDKPIIEIYGCQSVAKVSVTIDDTANINGIPST